MTGQQLHHQRLGHKSIQNERHSLGRPQMFVQLTFGVSWSDRHIPQSHTLSYTSKNLKSARDSGHFPRQAPSNQQYRRQDLSQRQHRGERHHRDHERPRSRPGGSRPPYAGAQTPSREPRSDSRRAANERGSSAPPPIHNSPWSEEEGEPSATLFPGPARATRNSPSVWKDLPTDPARFRLGEDGLPWSASAWPFHADGDEDENEPPFANLPTIVPLSPPNRRRGEDPHRVRELASLSTAMMTVDNGFENQWWNQGQRESVPWFPSDPNQGDDHAMSIDDAAFLSAAEPPSAVETYSPNSQSFRDLVSPLSDFHPSFSIPGPLQRSWTSQSDDELWMGK